MGRSAKTRFVVNFESKSRELLSVREIADKTLIVILRSEDRGVPEDPFGGASIASVRLSVHPSMASVQGGITLKSTRLTTTGRTATHVAFIQGDRRSHFAPAFVKLCPILDDRYIVSERPKDTVVNTGTFDYADLTTLILSVVILDKDVEVPRVRGFAVSFVDFTKFRFVVYSTYANFPASLMGLELFLATNQMEVDGSRKDGPRFEDAQFMPLLSLPHFLLNKIQLVAATHITRLAQEVGPSERNLLNSLQLWFHESPRDLALGRLERGI